MRRPGHRISHAWNARAASPRSPSQNFARCVILSIYVSFFTSGGIGFNIRKTIINQPYSDELRPMVGMVDPTRL